MEVCTLYQSPSVSPTSSPWQTPFYSVSMKILLTIEWLLLLNNSFSYIWDHPSLSRLRTPKSLALSFYSSSKSPSSAWLGALLKLWQLGGSDKQNCAELFSLNSTLKIIFLICFLTLIFKGHYTNLKIIDS